jgi:hypothetical protein
MTWRIPVTLRSATTAILFAASALLAPASTHAQITTFVAPPRKATVDSVKAIVAANTARSDSVARMSLSNMKEWVDSAAGVGTPTPAATDTMAASQEVAAATTPAPTRGATTSFSNGAIAPNTASPLPLLLVLGIASLAGGLTTLRFARSRS